MSSADELRRQASFARFNEADKQAVMADLGQAIAALDRVMDQLEAPGLLEVRRELVEMYLDFLAIRLRPFDQEEGAPAPRPDAMTRPGDSR